MADKINGLLEKFPDLSQKECLDLAMLLSDQEPRNWLHRGILGVAAVQVLLLGVLQPEDGSLQEKD